jgi:hypothetical protein
MDVVDAVQIVSPGVAHGSEIVVGLVAVVDLITVSFSFIVCVEAP